MGQDRSFLTSRARAGVAGACRRRALRKSMVNCEALETRELLSGAGTTIFSSPGTIAAPRGTDTIALPLTTNRVSPGHSGKSLLNFEVLPTAGGKFRAGRFQLLNAQGKKVRARLMRGPQGAIEARAVLPPGDYSIRVRGRGRSTGSFVALVTVPSPTRKIVRAGTNATSNVLNFQIVNHTGNVRGKNPAFASSQIYVDIYGKDPNYASSVNPDGWITINASGQISALTPSQTQVPAFTLNQAPGGVPVLNTEPINSGQIYIGMGASVVNSVNTGVVTVNVANGGSGYTSPPAVSFSGGDGSGAQATANLDTNGAVTSVTITQTGNGYTSAPTVTFSGGGGSGAQGTANLQILGVAAPSPSNPSDPNANVYWDFAEFTMTPAAGTVPLNINADISQVDEVGYPLTLRLSPNDPAFPHGAGVYPARANLLSAFQNYLNAQPAGAGASEFLPLLTGQPSGPQGADRILAPSNYVLINKSSTLASYYNSTIDQVFSLGRTMTMTVPSGQQPVTAATATATVSGGQLNGLTITNPGSVYIFPPDVTFSGGGGTGAAAQAQINAAGQVVGFNITDPGSGYTSPPTVSLTMDTTPWTFNGQVVQIPNTTNPAAPYTALQLTGQNGAQKGLVYNIYSPNTPGPVTPAAANGATWMVFACAGVFADNVQQFSNANQAGNSTMLGNLENQLVSAMNRGIALLPSSDWSNASTFYPSGSTANWYSAFLHQPSVTIDGHAYGFAYDDQGGNSTDMSVSNPAAMIVTLGWNSPLFVDTSKIHPRPLKKRPRR